MKAKIALLLVCLLTVGLLAGCGGSPAPAATAEPTQTEAPAQSEAPAASPAVADASQMTTVEDVVEEGMTPVYAESLVDGSYPVTVDSSSSMFRITDAVLTVENGEMNALLTMSGTSYLYLYPGTALEAATAEGAGVIEYVEDADGAYTYTFPVEALDAGVACAAYSKNKELWYDRTLCFRADSLPQSAFREGFFTTAESLGLADGRYMVAVTLSGGSGKASVQSPTALYVEDGRCEAIIGWSSKNYDYMKVDGVQYLPIPNEDNSAFRIPVSFFDRPMAVIADTVAMSQPYEIEYTLVFDSASIEAAP